MTRFIDTNIFIYQLDSSDKHKHRIAESLIKDALATGNGCTSAQVAQECLNVALRKAAVPLTPDALRRYLEVVLGPLVQVTTTTHLLHRALDAQARWRFSFYDSLVVAGALTAGCRTLLTEDLQHGQRLDGLTVVNPFLG